MTTRFLVLWAFTVSLIALAAHFIPVLLKPRTPVALSCEAAEYVAVRDLPAAWWLRSGDLRPANEMHSDCIRAYEGLYSRSSSRKGDRVSLYDLRRAPEIKGENFTVLAIEPRYAAVLNTGGSVAIFGGSSACYKVPVLAVWQSANGFEGAFAVSSVKTCAAVVKQPNLRVVPQILEPEVPQK